MQQYAWARWGDLNAFFGLMLDNVAVMVILLTTIAAPPDSSRPDDFRFTPEFVLTRMIPGTALGVLVGDLIYTWMAFRLARRTGRSDVTAMPLGLDTPSTFGVAFLVLLPALHEGHRLGLDNDAAMEFAWRVGVVVLLMIGVFKVLVAPLGNAVRRLVPSAGLLGSLAAIALVLIAFVPLILDGVAAVPLVGLLSLTVVLVTLVAHRSLPVKLPGALVAVVLGVGLYMVAWALGPVVGVPLVPPLTPSAPPAWSPPPLLSAFGESFGDWPAVWQSALAKLPVALPFALATIVGGIDCTESAAAAGDEYDTRGVLLTEGASSLVAAGLGGVIQTTPYIGHPAYKAMGGRAAYTLATALFVGAAGYFGVFSVMFGWLPQAAMFPILIFVGLEITAQSFRATPQRHYPALALAVMPALAAMAMIPVNQLLAGKPLAEAPPVVFTLNCLANGFIVTSLLWAASLAAVLDGHLTRGAGYLLIAAVCALFGVIHSPLPDAPLALPTTVWERMPADAVRLCQSPYHWSAAYLLSAAVLFALSRFRSEPPSEVALP